jgi:hypothetical protein
MESELQMLSRHDASPHPHPHYNVLLLGDEFGHRKSARRFSYSVIRKFLFSSQGYGMTNEYLQAAQFYLSSVSRIRSENMWKSSGVAVAVTFMEGCRTIPM